VPAERHCNTPNGHDNRGCVVRAVRGVLPNVADQPWSDPRVSGTRLHSYLPTAFSQTALDNATRCLLRSSSKGCTFTTFPRSRNDDRLSEDKYPMNLLRDSSLDTETPRSNGSGAVARMVISARFSSERRSFTARYLFKLASIECLLSAKQET
jgi:hypothetical protein